MKLPIINYILDGHNPVPAKDINEWGEWFRNNERHVADTTIDDVRISTVFLGIDHGFSLDDPKLFETMIFGGERDQEQTRCSTWEQAEAMHEAMCSDVRKAQQ